MERKADGKCLEISTTLAPNPAQWGNGSRKHRSPSEVSAERIGDASLAAWYGERWLVKGSAQFLCPLTHPTDLCGECFDRSRSPSLFMVAQGLLQICFKVIDQGNGVIPSICALHIR